MKRKERFDAVLNYFREHNPLAETELNYTNPYELLVAVILSAQCTDKRVNLVTPQLFEEFPNAGILAEASPEQVFEKIKSISYPNNKAKHLVAMAQMLVHTYNNIVPADRDELQKLPGVGRKTANVIASVVYDQAAMAVDTHVFRVSARLGLTQGAKNPLQCEMQLIKYIPEADIARAHHWLILHGRYICKARKPACESCDLKDFCQWYSENN